jgi:hypothetical protein
LLEEPVEEMGICVREMTGRLEEGLVHGSNYSLDFPAGKEPAEIRG